MKHNNFAIIVAFSATVVICAPFPSQAAGKKTSPSPDTSSSTDADAPPAAAATPGGKVRAAPFKGIIAAVDDKAKTLPSPEKKRRIRSRSPIRLLLPEAVSPPR